MDRPGAPPAGDLAAGYRRIHLTTGSRQPEAAALYRSSGYVLLPGTARVYPGGVYDVGFEKHLC